MSPFDLLHPQAKQELVNYLVEGNEKHELARIACEQMSTDTLIDFVREVKRAHEGCGDYPHVDLIPVTEVPK